MGSVAYAVNTRDPLAPGRTVGKYEVVSRLASGGMAEIYLARATGIQGFEKHVVLKRILPQFAANETFVRLFLNEARVAATLDHPNIATVYDIGEAEGSYFFTMEYLHGEDAGHILTELAKKGMRLPLEHALTMVAGAASGLHFAHEKKASDGSPLGLVHRDVSPSNIVVTYDGGVKVVDFGIAKITANAEFTGTGSLKGKIAYMSPEQCSGQPIDRRSDVFALGVLLFELTTQTRLFKGETEVITINNVREARIPSPSDRVRNYPKDLELILKKVLARRAVDRFGSAREFQLALEIFAQKNGIALSNALLGDWMDTTFGPKKEPWRDLPPSRPAIETDMNAGKEPTPPRWSMMMPTAPAESSHPSAGLATMTMGATAAPPIRARNKRMTMLALAATGIGFVAITLAAGKLLWSPSGDNSASAVLVFPEQGNVSVGTEKAPAPPPSLPTIAATSPAPPSPAAPAAPAPVAPVAPVSAPRARPTKSGLAPRGQHFSAIFAKKEGEIGKCFAASSQRPDGVDQISVRFETDPTGHVTSVEVIPPVIANTPVGACIAKIAATTEFGPQAGAIAFRIPVSVSVRRTASSNTP